jgi:hypothetical protein
MLTQLLLLMLASFFGYTLLIASIYGIQTSVSESYYKLPRNLQWLFTIATWAYAIPAIIIGLELTDNGLVFLSGAAICFVGASPAFKSLGLEADVHLVGAVVGVLAMQLFLLVTGLWWITVAFIIISIITALTKTKNLTWWVEVWAFISIALAYVILV